MTDVLITIKIVIPDEEKFKREIYEQYGEINEENIEEFIDNHLTAYNDCDGLFLVEGCRGDTDGYIVQDCNIDELMEKIEDEEDDDDEN